MERTDRWYQIDRMLRNHRCVTMQQMIDSLEVSKPTIKRDLEYLRDRLHAPIIYDRSLRGYRYDENAEPFELPGFWLNASELHGLLAVEQLLEQVQPGLLAPHLEPLRQRIRDLLEQSEVPMSDLTARVRVISIAHRDVAPKCFDRVAEAVFQRRQLEIDHLRRESGETLARRISPQRIVHYRGNWYVDAWCHTRKALRSFSLDAISSAAVSERAAREISAADLDRHFPVGYGIFSGDDTQTAELLFSEKSARWVSTEHWHPDQTGVTDAQGRYRLTLPYSNDIELVMDILRYGPDVEVLAPASLRRAVLRKLRDAAAQYD